MLAFFKYLALSSSGEVPTIDQHRSDGQNSSCITLEKGGPMMSRYATRHKEAYPHYVNTVQLLIVGMRRP